MTRAERPRLGRAQIEQVRRNRRGVVAVPDESMLALPEQAVQFGTGGFLRGFIDDFLHRANGQGLFGGRVVAIGSTGSTRDRALRAQDGLYTLVVEGIDDGRSVQECRIIASVSRAISAVDEWDAVLALARAPTLQFVFSNTTEIGIAVDPGDRADDSPPKSFPAKLTRFLYERGREFDYDATLAPVVVPCELIENNGDVLRELTLGLADRWSLGARFREWLGGVHFCNTLVDRIVTGTPRGADAERVAEMLGYEDALVTTCEPYRLFAIEGDATLRDRLRWTAVDPAIIVAEDIAPYRERKVRLLNGAHTLLVPAALFMGCETVRDAVCHPALRRFVRHAMLEEIAPTVRADGAADFAEAVLDRFQNPFIRHALADIMLQATTKMRVRVVPSIVGYAARYDRTPQSLAFAFAAYLLLMSDGLRREGASAAPLPPDDRHARLETHWEGARGLPDTDDAVRVIVASVCGDRELWATDLGAVPGFVGAVTEHFQRSRAHGVAVALDHHLGSLVA
ncbi:MAG TPA: tagaturonate reductase [Gemmatimonadaceae bacterium]